MRTIDWIKYYAIVYLLMPFVVLFAIPVLCGIFVLDWMDGNLNY